MAAEIIGQDPVAETAAFTVTVEKGEEIKQVPFVYFPNLIAKIGDVIYQHERQVDFQLVIPTLKKQTL